MELRWSRQEHQREICLVKSKGESLDLVFLVGGASHGRWTKVRAINKFMEVVADEDSFNTKLLGEVVC